MHVVVYVNHVHLSLHNDIHAERKDSDKCMDKHVPVGWEEGTQ